jgi:hypothetical protein
MDASEKKHLAAQLARESTDNASRDLAAALRQFMAYPSTENDDDLQSAITRWQTSRGLENAIAEWDE